ncbi:MAG TPA: hypothetical protein VIG99_25680 [Myxococcaceae bacterium]|jgi:hypothetical protein
MKKLALVGCLVSAIAFAADKPAAPPMDKPMGGMMEGWTPRKVTKEDKKAITDSMDAMHKTMMGGNMEEVMANYDYPIFMMTDDKDGNVMTNMADGASWKKMMEPMIKGMAENKDMAAQMAKMPKPKTEIFYLTDSMVLVMNKMQMPMGKEKMEVRSSEILINKGGKWMVKGQMEGGWGDMAKKQMEEMKKSDMAKPTEMKSTAGTGGPTKGGMK